MATSKLLTKDYVTRNFEKCKTFYDMLGSMLNEVKREKEISEFDKEMEKYENETEEQFRKRFTDIKEWEEIEYDDRGEMEYAKLCSAEECWYMRNTDRLNGCTIYRMLGTEDFLLCDICYNDFHNLDDYIYRNGLFKKRRKHN